MKIDLGPGLVLEPGGDGPEQFRKRIVKQAPIAGTQTGKHCVLECGHTVMTFGTLDEHEPVVLCTACRDKEGQA